MSTTWNKLNEYHLIRWAQKASSYEWMHNKASIYYNKRGNIIIISSIVLGSIASVLELILMTLFFSIEMSKIAVGCLIVLPLVFNIVAVMLTTIYVSLNYNDLKVNHKTDSDKFSVLATKIYNNLALNRQDRDISAKDYLNQIQIEYEEIRSKNNDTLPNKIIKQYTERTKNLEIAKPEIIGLNEEDIFNIDAKKLANVYKSVIDKSNSDKSDENKSEEDKSEVEIVLQTEMQKEFEKLLKEHKKTSEPDAYLKLDNYMTEFKNI